MSNVLLTIGMITNEALSVLVNELTFTGKVERKYDNRFGQPGAKIGDTVNIRKPVRYIGRRTPTLSVESSVETSVPLTLTDQYGTDMSFTAADLVLSIDEFSDRFIKPAVANIANMIDFDGLQQYVNIYNAVGTPGSLPTTLTPFLDAGVKLDNEAAPRGMRYICLSPAAQASVVGGLTTIFNPTKEISDQYLKGSMGKAAGFDWYMDQNVAVHTGGTYAANIAGNAVTVTTTVTSGSSVVTGGWTAGDQLNEGDIITFDTVFAVNPQNRQSTGQLRQFTVTADAVADGGGAMTISVSPSMVFSGSQQTVYSASGNLAATTPLDTFFSSGQVSTQNLAFCKEAFAFANGRLETEKMPGVDNAAAVSKQLNMTIRLIHGYDIINDRRISRLDLLGGWQTIRPELACRIAS